jgi:hypothetical protein
MVVQIGIACKVVLIRTKWPLWCMSLPFKASNLSAFYLPDVAAPI